MYLPKTPLHYHLLWLQLKDVLGLTIDTAKLNKSNALVISLGARAASPRVVSFGLLGLGTAPSKIPFLSTSITHHYSLLCCCLQGFLYPPLWSRDDCSSSLSNRAINCVIISNKVLSFDSTRTGATAPALAGVDLINTHSKVILIATLIVFGFLCFTLKATCSLSS